MLVTAGEEAWRFLSQARGYGSGPEIERHFARAIGAYGYDRYSCMLVKAKSFIKEPPTLFEQSFNVWDQHYWSSRYFAGDPCADALRAYRAPFAWSDVRAVSDPKQAEAMWGEASDIGMNDGFVVRVFAPEGRQLVVRMTTGASDTDPAARAVLESLATVFATLMLRHYEEREDDADGGVITRREAECLHWASRGRRIGRSGVFSQSHREPRTITSRARNGSWGRRRGCWPAPRPPTSACSTVYGPISGYRENVKRG